MEWLEPPVSACPFFVTVIKLKVQNVIENLTARNTNRKFQLNFISCVEWCLLVGWLVVVFARLGALVSLYQNCDNIPVSLILNHINSWNDTNLNRFWRARTNIDTMKSNHVNWHANTQHRAEEMKSEKRLIRGFKQSNETLFPPTNTG